MEPSLTAAQVERVLVVHADADTRNAVETALRNAGGGGLSVYAAPSLGAAVGAAQRSAPRVVLLDLVESLSLALEVAAQLRGRGCYVIGLYSPLTAVGRDVDVLRRAARAGVGDFVPLPVSEAELAAALAAVPAAGATAQQGDRGRMVAFFGPKGGVGVTTLALNTALAMASDGEDGSTALCDTNLQCADAAAFLGLQPDRDICDAVADLDQLGPMESYLVREPGTGLLLLPGAREPAAGQQVAPDDVARLLIALRKRYANLVVDVPSTIDLLTVSVLELSEAICLVTEPLMPTLVGTARCLEYLESLGLAPDRMHIVLNRGAFFAGALSTQEVERELGRKVAVTVPYEVRVADAADTGRPLLTQRSKSDFVKTVRQLARSAPGWMRGNGEDTA